MYVLIFCGVVGWIGLGDTVSIVGKVTIHQKTMICCDFIFAWAMWYLTNLLFPAWIF